MYDLLVVGNPVTLLRDGNEPGEVILGPSVVSASVAARLGISDMVLVGNIAEIWRDQLIEDLDRYSVPEHYLIGKEQNAATTIPTPVGDTVQVGLSTERIAIRDFPTEFLTAKYIILAPFSDEIDVELTEWIASSSNATIIWDPGLFRLRNNNAIPLMLNRVELVRFLKSVDIVSINASECDHFVGTSDPLVAAELIVEWGARSSIVTDGAQGSILYDGTDFVRIPSYPIDNGWKCWTGAAFVAGLTRGLLQDEDLVSSTAMASSVASVYIELDNRYGPLDTHKITSRQHEILERVEYK